MSVYEWSSGIKIMFDRRITTVMSEINGMEDFPSADLATSFVLMGTADYSSYIKQNAVDGNTATYWRSNSTVAGQWLGVDFGTSVPAYKLRIRMDYASGRINGYKVEGSDDAITWNTMASGNFINASGWQDVTFESISYRYWRIYTTSRFSSYYTITEFVFYAQRDAYSIPAGWVITGLEPDKSPEGQLVPTNYSIRKIEKADGDYSVILWLTLPDRMKYPIGNVTVTFNGIMQGAGGGYVEPFVLSFAPQNISPIFNPNDVARIEMASITLTIARLQVQYISGFNSDEYATEMLDVTLNMIRTHINDLPE